jgi:4-hydroxybenzoyl-CoA reductase subunit beta
MKLPRVEYIRPACTAEACRTLQAADGEAQVIAGGTELVLALKNRQKRPRLLVDLDGLGRLKEISYAPESGLRIGAMATMRRVANHAAVRSQYPLLAQAALSAGSVQLQAMGTIGGNICQDNCCQYFNRSERARRSWEPCHKLGGSVCHVVKDSKECWASYAGDMAPALLAMRAQVAIADAGGEKVVPLRELFSGDGARPNTLRPGQIVTEIQVPAPGPRSGQLYRKLRQRGTLDYPLLAVAVNLKLEKDRKTCKEASLALTGVERAPFVVEEAQQLTGAEVTRERIAEVGEAARRKSHPMMNICDLPASYRRQMVNVYVESSVQHALRAAGLR